MRTHRPHPALPALRSVLAGLTLALVLTACSSTDAPAPPPYEPTPDVRAQPTPTVPVDEVRSPRDFIEELQTRATEAQLSGSTERYRVYARGCGPCERFADLVDAIYKRGGSIASAGSAVRDFETITADAQQVLVEYTLVAKPTILTMEAGAEPTTIAGGRARIQTNLVVRGDDFRIVRQVRVPR